MSYDKLRKKFASENSFLRNEKIYFNSRRLIDEIFDNETNKALLQMKIIESKSREKSIKKHKY